jgi:hypothetical protein
LLLDLFSSLTKNFPFLFQILKKVTLFQSSTPLFNLHSMKEKKQKTVAYASFNYSLNRKKYEWKMKIILTQSNTYVASSLGQNKDQNHHCNFKTATVDR